MSQRFHCPLAFSTLACPDWSWELIVQKAVEYGYQGLELRGVEGEMDLTKAGPFSAQRLAATKSELKERGLAVPCLDTSCRFDQASEIGENLDEGRRHIDLAVALDAPAIRVFGDSIADAQSRDRIIEQVIQGLQVLAQHAEGTHVQVLLESHGDFARLQNLLDVIQVVKHPNVGILWDVHHPYRFFSEPLAETYEKLKDSVKHVHLKNSIVTADGVRYCLMGQGDLQVNEVLQLLSKGHYNGWISLEWEKRWHPEIEEPEVALPEFISVLHKAETELANQ
jgi:sugar phosphate isomerase/epimerase